jgi:hypothetical protein
MTTPAAAIGAAVHSGWAALVALAQAPQGLTVVARCRANMVDEQDLDSKQPYHALEAVGLEAARERLRIFERSAAELAHAALRDVIQNLEQRGYVAGSFGILDSSGRSSDSLASTLASHALIHTADGDHFRSALAAAAQRCGLIVQRAVAKGMEEQAKSRLNRSSPQLRDMLSRLGKQVGPPWGEDQKRAALLAWMLLA